MSPNPSTDLERRPIDRAVLIEVLVVVALASLTYRSLRDPSGLLTWLFGSLPERPFVHLQPWLGLLRAITNTCVFALVCCVMVRAHWAEWVRRAAGCWLVFATLLLPIASHIEVRFRVDEAPGNEAPYRSAFHDGGVAQTEMAVDALLSGQNPYAARYDRPPMSRSIDSDPAGWRSIGYRENPAFDHLPYPPGGLSVAAPVAVVTRLVFGKWDVRLVYLAAALVLAWAFGSLVAPGPWRRIAWLVTLLSPLLHNYLIVGRNDSLVLLALVLSSIALSRQRWRACAAWLGIAIVMKQFAVLVAPFFLFVMWEQTGRNWRALLQAGWLAAAIPAALVLPFLLWDPAAFLDDVLLFNMGTGDPAYPVRWDGFGATPLAYGLGLVEHPSGSNPLGWLFPVATLGAFALCGHWLRQNPTAERALIASGVLLFAALFSSRFFADNYLAVPVALWAVAVLAPPQIRKATP